LPEHYPDTEVDEAVARSGEERQSFRHDARGRDGSTRWRFDDAVQAARFLGAVSR
jgi:hypothetical protein